MCWFQESDLILAGRTPSARCWPKKEGVFYRAVLDAGPQLLLQLIPRLEVEFVGVLRLRPASTLTRVSPVEAREKSRSTRPHGLTTGSACELPAPSRLHGFIFEDEKTRRVKSSTSFSALMQQNQRFFLSRHLCVLSSVTGIHYCWFGWTSRALYGEQCTNN